MNPKEWKLNKYIKDSLVENIAKSVDDTLNWFYSWQKLNKKSQVVSFFYINIQKLLLFLSQYY